MLAIGNGPEIEKLGAAVPYAEAARLDLRGHGNSSARGAARHRSALCGAGPAGAASARDRLGRNRPRLSLRPLAARRPGASVSPATWSRRARRGSPIIIHCREAWPDCLKILDEDWRSSGLGGIFHCFTGTLEEARRGMDMGFLISFAGNVTYPKAQNLRTLRRDVPLDRLLVETDSPFLAPQPHRGRRNEPAYVAEVARTIGNVRNLPADELPGQRPGIFAVFSVLRVPAKRSMEVPGGTPSHF